MQPKSPAILLVLVETRLLRWFVAAIELDGTATPLICSEVNDLARCREEDFDEQVAFLRHRFCGAMQRGCDRLWARSLKACQFVFVFETPLPEATGELTRAVAGHMAEWMLNPPVAVFTSAGFRDGASHLDLLAGVLEAPREELVRSHLGELLAKREDESAWEAVRKNGAWCVNAAEAGT